MPSTLLAIHGTVTRPGRLYQAIEASLSGLDGEATPTVDLLHLGDHRISFADGRPLPDYDDDTEAVVNRVMAADMCLIATPVFRASYTGALKNLLDHVPVAGLQGKACGLIVMGATDHHYLSVDTQLRPVLAWFGGPCGPRHRVLAVPPLPGRPVERRTGHRRPAFPGAFGGRAPQRRQSRRPGRPLSTGCALISVFHCPSKPPCIPRVYRRSCLGIRRHRGDLRFSLILWLKCSISNNFHK